KTLSLVRRVPVTSVVAGIRSRSADVNPLQNHSLRCYRSVFPEGCKKNRRPSTNSPGAAHSLGDAALFAVSSGKIPRFSRSEREQASGHVATAGKFLLGSDNWSAGYTLCTPICPEENAAKLARERRPILRSYRRPHIAGLIRLLSSPPD